MSGCLAVPAAALSVALEPIQDLHGYSYPWAGGAGKNKLTTANITSNKFLNSAGEEVDASGYSITDYLPVSASTQYCVSGTANVNSTYTGFYDDSKNLLSTVAESGETFTFTTPANTKYVRVTLRNVASNNPQLEVGSSATSYAPYTNICPISGRTGSSVVAHGKNLIDNSSKGMYQATADSSVLRYGYTPITLKAGTYTVSYRKKTSASVTMYLTNMDTWNYTEISPTGTTVTLASDSQVFLRSGFTSAIEFDTEFEDAQIEYGSQATAYVPYVQPSTATLTFGTTVYGGQVDFKTGIVTVEWGYIASYNGETLPSEWISDRDAYEAGTTPTTGAEVAYKLATPTELTLTPALLTMLKGYNNISGDGVITITAYAINEEVGA